MAHFFLIVLMVLSSVKLRMVVSPPRDLSALRGFDETQSLPCCTSVLFGEGSTSGLYACPRSPHCSPPEFAVFS